MRNITKMSISKIYENVKKFLKKNMSELSENLKIIKKDNCYASKKFEKSLKPKTRTNFKKI